MTLLPWSEMININAVVIKYGGKRVPQALIILKIINDDIYPLMSSDPFLARGGINVLQVFTLRLHSRNPLEW